MSRNELWLDLYKAALAGAALYAADPINGPTAFPKRLAEAAGNAASEGVGVVLKHRGLDAPVERLLRAVEGLGLFVEYPDEVAPRLRAVFDAAAAVKAARES